MKYVYYLLIFECWIAFCSVIKQYLIDTVFQEHIIHLVPEYPEYVYKAHMRVEPPAES